MWKIMQTSIDTKKHTLKYENNILHCISPSVPISCTFGQTIYKFIAMMSVRASLKLVVFFALRWASLTIRYIMMNYFSEFRKMQEKTKHWNIFGANIMMQISLRSSCLFFFHNMMKRNFWISSLIFNNLYNLCLCIFVKSIIR